MAWGQHPSSRRSTLPPDWPKIRQRVLNRDRRQCQIRGPHCVRTATEVDHVGDRHDHSLEQLRSACTPCHTARSAQQGATASGTARRARVAARRRPQERHPGVLD